MTGVGGSGVGGVSGVAGVSAGGGAPGSGGAGTGGTTGSGGSSSLGQWHAAELVETDDAGDASIPQVAIDSSGNAIAVWFQSDGIRRNVWANRFVPGAGWGTATLIEINDGGPAENPQVAVDASGNAIAVWEQQPDGDHYSIWANRYVAGVGWGTATLVQPNSTVYARSPQVAVDPSGNATAVWTQTEGDGTRHDTWANRYVPGSGWGTATLLGTDNDGLAGYAPQVAVDIAGNVTAVWEQSAETSPTVWVNRYVPGAGWGTATLLVPAGSSWASGPAVAVDPSGNVVVVWNQSDAVRSHVWGKRYVPNSGWGTATQIDTDAVSAVSPRVAVDASGNAVAVWSQLDATPRVSISASRFVPGSGWGTATLLETDDGEAWNPQVAVDASGNAIAVWNQSDGTRFDVWANRYVAGAGWGTAILLETDNAGHAGSPQVAVSPTGQAVAVWHQSNGSRYDIRANSFR